MDSSFSPKFRIITISGKIATGTSTLSQNLVRMLGWKHINFGALQRQYDRDHGINENQQGATARPDDHEREMEEMGKKILKEKKNIIYEAWLAGFLARGYKDVLKVLIVCSHDDIRVDRVANRDNLTIDEAKKWIKQRELENERKWKDLYGDHDFWNPQHYDLIIDTYATGQMETVGRVLDKLGK